MDIMCSLHMKADIPIRVEKPVGFFFICVCVSLCTPQNYLKQSSVSPESDKKKVIG